MALRARSRNLVLAAAIVAVSAVVVFLVARLGGKPETSIGELRFPSAASAAVERGPTVAEEAVGSGKEQQRTDIDPSSVSTSPAPVPDGILRLAFVSALDGTPVPDLPFQVYRERGGGKSFAQGRSDALGRAEVRDLEENVILVETPRRPPFANKVAACWLGRGETKELVVRLDGGARLTGRVVDDEGVPVEGAEILAHGDVVLSAPRSPLDAEVIAAVTCADGRFAVDHVADVPTGIWIVDGEERPEHWRAAGIVARKDCAFVLAKANVRPGEAVDVGDVVLEGCGSVSGVVLDPEGHALAGALVSGRDERRYARRYGAYNQLSSFSPSPGQDGFRLHVGETVSDSAGKFEIRAVSQQANLMVGAPSGQRQSFDIPGLSRGEKLDDLVLRLDAITLLEVELLDAQGVRVTGPGPAARETNLQVFRRGGLGIRGRNANAIVECEDGSRERIEASADADGLFRLECKASPSTLRSLSLDLPGYKNVRDRLTGKVSPITPLTYALEEIPALRLRLKPASGARPTGALPAHGIQLRLQACVASPEQRANGPRPVGFWTCCGLGAAVGFAWDGEPRTFVLPAVGPPKYWVYLSAFGEERGFVDLLSAGPFEAGEATYDIEADPARLLELLGRIGEEAKSPPEKTEPGRRAGKGFLSFRLVDAKTDQPIEDGWMDGRRTDAHQVGPWFPTIGASTEPSLQREAVPTGKWVITANGDGYRSIEIPDVLVVEDETVDLGTIALEPLPAYRGRLLESNRQPVPNGTRIRVLDRSTGSGEETWVSVADEEGHFIVHGVLPERSIVQANYDAGQGAQRLLVDGWRPGEEKEIVLAPWQRIEVHLGGAALDPPGNALALSACAAHGTPTTTCDHRSEVAPAHEALLRGEEIEATPTRRVYRFTAAPGRYQVFGRGLLHEVPVQDIEVRDSRELQVFDLSSR